MTDKEYKEQKARIKKLIKRWYGAGFGWWRIDYEYQRTVKEPEEGGDIAAKFTVAQCATNWEYRTALITFYMPTVAEQSDEELENQFVHEHAHILIGAIQDFSSDETRQLTEYTAENVARALIWSRGRG